MSGLQFNEKCQVGFRIRVEGISSNDPVKQLARPNPISDGVSQSSRCKFGDLAAAQLDRSLDICLGSGPVPVLFQSDQPQRGMSFGQRFIKLQCLRSRSFRSREGLFWCEDLEVPKTT